MSLLRDEVFTITLTAYGPVSRWRSLWIKFVNGFDPSKHCQPGLLGWTLPSLASKLQPGVPMGIGPGAPGSRPPYMGNKSARFDAIYLCGVHESWDWSKNLHLVAVPEYGAVAEVRASTGTVFRINGARQVDIPDLPLGFDGRDKSFTTCRNWRFGVAYYGLDPRRQAFDPLGRRGVQPAT